MQAAFDSRTSASINLHGGMQAQAATSFNSTQSVRGFAQPVSHPPSQFDMPHFSNAQGGGRGQSNMSSTVFSQQSTQTPHGSASSTFYQQVSTSSQRGRNDRVADSRCDNRGSQSNWQSQNATSYSDSRASQCNPQQNNWSNTAVSNGKSSIDLGDYKLDLNKKDSSILLRNAQTGDTTKIWGDPHINLHNGSGQQTSGMFNGPLTFNLPDNTKITVGTQQKGKVSYADNLTITRGNDAYVVNNLSEKNKSALTVERQGNGRALDAATPDGHELVAKRSGSGWIDPQTGKEPTAADFGRF